MHLSTGTNLDGKFEIISLLGEGGMGAVYLARQIGLDRIVALKFLKFEEMQDAEAVARLEREAQALSELRHKGIVSVYGLQSFHGHPFIVMEHVAGRSLQSLLYENQPLEIAFVSSLTSIIGDALAAAHRSGIVHRDLKPTNVIVADNGDIKLLDFGLAKLLPSYGKPVQQLTDVGTAVGSVLYMSPEQCVGQPCDERSDIYAFACLIFHCLTGRPPFMADHAVVVMSSHVSGVVPTLRELGLQDRYPSSVQMVLDKAMEKNVDHRYKNVHDFSQDLVSALNGELPGSYTRKASLSIPLPVNSPRARASFRGGLFAIVVAIVFGGISFLIYQNYVKESRSAQLAALRRVAENLSAAETRSQSEDLKLISYWTKIRELEKVDGNVTEHSATKLYDAYSHPMTQLEDFSFILGLAQKGIDCKDLSALQHETIVQFTVKAGTSAIRKRLVEQRERSLEYAVKLDAFLRKNKSLVTGASLPIRTQFYLDWALLLDLAGDTSGAIRRLQEIEMAIARHSPGSSDHARVCYELAILEAKVDQKVARSYARRELEILTKADTSAAEDAQWAILIALGPELVRRKLSNVEDIEKLRSKFTDSELVLCFTDPLEGSWVEQVWDGYRTEVGPREHGARLYTNLAGWYRRQGRMTESDQALRHAFEFVEADKSSAAQRVQWYLQSQMIENDLLRNNVGKMLKDSKALLEVMGEKDELCKLRVCTQCALACLILNDDNSAQAFALNARRLLKKKRSQVEALDRSRIFYALAEIARRSHNLAESRKLVEMIRANIPEVAPWKDFLQLQKLINALDVPPDAPKEHKV